VTAPAQAVPAVAPHPARRALSWWRARDPEHFFLNKAVRAALVVTVAFALGQATGNRDAALLSVFGSFAFLLMVDFSGPPRARLLDFTLLLGSGLVLVAGGTLASEHPAAAVVGTLVIAFGLLFGSVVSPAAAAATTAALLLWVLPVAIPAGASSVLPRLGGLLLGASLSVAAALLFLPPASRSPLRRGLVDALSALAELALVGTPDGPPPGPARDRARATVRDVRAGFSRSPSLPAGAGRAQDALCRLVGRLEWLEDLGQQVAAGGPEAVSLELQVAASRTLAAAATALEAGADRSGRPTAPGAELARAAADMGARRDESIRAAVDQVVARGLPAAPPGDTAQTLMAFVDPTFAARALSIATGQVAEDVLVTATVRPGGRLGAWLSGAVIRLRAHATLGSVWLHNALRGALGIGLAVLVVEVTAVAHGFWVVLGTLSVLRSNALGTGASAVRALAGTVAGVAVGSLLLWPLGHHPAALWAIFPVAVLLAGLTPALGSLAAGQAAFTVVVLILFRILEPEGGSVGLVRLEDVALGCVVAAVVGLLFWPRGARRALSRTLAQAYAAGSAYLGRALDRLLDPAYAVDTGPAQARTLDAVRRLDDAYRQYLMERGRKVLTRTEVSTLLTGAVRVRMAAEALATLPALPLDPSVGTLPEVAEAGRRLRATCDQLQAWYEGVATAFTRGSGALPPVPDHPRALDAALLRALGAAGQEGRPQQVREVLRLLWADEDLAAQHQLQTELVAAAGLVGRSRGA
jgi:uncharacterized membrane protein YccC